MLHRWIQVHLQDPEPHVRQERMRTLSESLYDLVYRRTPGGRPHDVVDGVEDLGPTPQGS